MCVPIFSPKTPDAPKIFTPIEQPKPLDSSLKDARNEERRRAASSAGRSSTILTSSLGLSDKANVKKKTLLGQ